MREALSKKRNAHQMYDAAGRCCRDNRCSRSGNSFRMTTMVILSRERGESVSHSNTVIIRRVTKEFIAETTRCCRQYRSSVTNGLEIEQSISTRAVILQLLDSPPNMLHQIHNDKAHEAMEHRTGCRNRRYQF